MVAQGNSKVGPSASITRWSTPNIEPFKTFFKSENSKNQALYICVFCHCFEFESRFLSLIVVYHQQTVSSSANQKAGFVIVHYYSLYTKLVQQHLIISFSLQQIHVRRSVPIFLYSAYFLVLHCLYKQTTLWQTRQTVKSDADVTFESVNIQQPKFKKLTRNFASNNSLK